MYITNLEIEIKPLIGRPKREDKTTRANFKLNTGIRRALKNDASLNSRSESAQVERLVIESETLRRVLKKYPELAALFLPKFNEELPKVAHELTEIEHTNESKP